MLPSLFLYSFTNWKQGKKSLLWTCCFDFVCFFFFLSRFFFFIFIQLLFVFAIHSMRFHLCLNRFFCSLLSLNALYVLEMDLANASARRAILFVLEILFCPNATVFHLVLCFVFCICILRAARWKFGRNWMAHLNWTDLYYIILLAREIFNLNRNENWTGTWLRKKPTRYFFFLFCVEVRREIFCSFAHSMKK